jgi:hypothetical protein
MLKYSRRTALLLGSAFCVSGFKLPGVNLKAVTDIALSDPLFDNRSIGEVYVATSRVIHLTTAGIGKGIISAAKALEIKTELDIPDYLKHIDAVKLPNSYSAQVKERDAKMIEIASNTSKEIKDKLDGGFSLSDAAKKELENAYTSVSLAEIYQGKAAKGGIKFGTQFLEQPDPASALLPLFKALKLDLDISQFVMALAGFGSDVSSLFSNVGGIFDVKEAIATAEDMSDVKLAKAEYLDTEANNAIDEKVTDDLEKFAS